MNAKSQTRGCWSREQGSYLCALQPQVSSLLVIVLQKKIDDKDTGSGSERIIRNQKRDDPARLKVTEVWENLGKFKPANMVKMLLPTLSFYHGKPT